MPAPEIVEALRVRFGAEPAPLGVSLPAASLLAAMRALRDTYGYRSYVTATALERDGRFEVAHAVRDVEMNDTLFVRVRVQRDGAEIDSLAFVYAGAEWHEREILDLFGIAFRGHPDPRRILLPDEYVGHPLRKDFAIETPWGYRP
ncbi:MAG TPA: NADH-quinone oxidoreductase subunit C [Candidatus Polarisedimenticolaceae bacterium]|nr:NADH-quinone oxidoreductase subunit C [Candidatus Polarisedimenticolaceae bacterium]